MGEVFRYMPIVKGAEKSIPKIKSSVFSEFGSFHEKTQGTSEIRLVEKVALFSIIKSDSE